MKLKLFTRITFALALISGFFSLILILDFFGISLDKNMNLISNSESSNVINKNGQSITLDTIRRYFKVNENKETYGTYIDKGDGEFEEPDLMEVLGDNDVEGYVRKSDLYDEANQPNNPEEAIVYMEKREKEGPRVIPVYKKDGKTIIGQYTLQ